MNLPAEPQGKHTERPRGQRGKPPGGISRLCKTDGREERGQLSGVETGGSPDAATPPGPREAPTTPAPQHPALGASSSPPAAPFFFWRKKMLLICLKLRMGGKKNSYGWKALS